MNGELRKLRLETKTPAKEMVKVVRGIYPKYDKSMQSKCERGDEYGVQIRPDALNALYKVFAPEKMEREEPKPKSSGHRLSCRISCRLEDEIYADLVQYIKADGYKTMQDWLSDVVSDYISSKKNGVD